MLICELANSQIKCILPNDLKIKPATAYELTCYEIPTLEEIKRARADSAEIANNIEKGLKDIQRNQGSYIMEFSFTIFTKFSQMPLISCCYFISFCNI